MTCPRFTPFVRRLLASCLFVFALFTSIFAADKKTFDIPAGTADKSLKQFTAQSGAEVIYPAEIVRGVKTPAVKGEMTLEEAIQRLLADTTLNVKRDEKSSTFMISRDPNVQRVALEKSSVHPDQSKIEEGKLVLDTLEVTGSRIRGVLGEATAQPVVTYTRQELDRFGATTFADLQRYIPQLPQTNWNRQLETALSGVPEVGSNTSAIGYSDFGAGLRNMGNTATLVLVDGRRVPKLGQLFSTSSAYDLSGIPLSAVERIEVLMDGASAVYGADALAGVINIILKKEYRGTELLLRYGNTFESDTAERQAQLTYGFASGKFSMNLSVGWEKTNSLAPRDRWWSASADKRPYGGFDGRSAFPDLQGGVRSVDGANLPGLNSPQAAIPVNSTGRNLTIADFANAPIPDPFDAPKYLDYGHRVSEYALLSGRYTIKPWLELFWNGSWRKNTTHTGINSVPNTASNSSFSRVTLPASYPGNPFGVPIYLDRALYEFIPVSTTTFSTTAPTWLVGARGDLANNWRYEVAVSKRWSEYGATGYTLSNGQGANALHGKLNASVNNPDTAQQIILLQNALTTTPHSADFYRPFLQPRDVQEAPDVWLYDFKADGPLWKLPAGTVQAAIGGEMQEDYANLGQVNSIQRLGGSFKRETLGLYAEAQIPIFAPEQNLPLVHKLSVSISGRNDHYSDFKGSTVPRYSLFYYPVKAMAVRASFGKGYKVPTLFQLYRLISSGSGAFTFGLLDPLRGGEAVGSYAFINGGNPDLVPEESENRNIGLLVEVPGVKGLSFSVDYYDLKHTNRVANDTQALVNYFPERITRAAPTAADTAAGYAGVITAIDQRFINIASFHSAGFDFELRYERTFAGLGDLLVRATATKPEVSELRNRPDTPLIDSTAQIPWRGTGYVYLTRGPWEFGAVATFASDYLTTSTTIEHVWLWDAQISYSLARARWQPSGWKQHLLRDLKLGLQVINVFDKEPQTLSGSSLGNVDPRGRRYQLTIQKRF